MPSAQSSQWLPISAVPGTIVAVAVTKLYPQGVAVAVGVRVGVGGVPVGVTVGVPQRPAPSTVSVYSGHPSLVVTSLTTITALLPGGTSNVMNSCGSGLRPISAR